SPSTGNKFGHQCAGTLISGTWLVTAAHCVLHPASGHAIPPRLWLACTGVRWTKRPSCVRVRKIAVHQRFRHANYTHDLALMNLARSLSAAASPSATAPTEICLPPTGTGSESTSGFEGRDCVVSGWGASTPPKPLQKGEGPQGLT
ncbi:unnamed protein product, partial [Ixodes hexagonus]